MIIVLPDSCLIHVQFFGFKKATFSKMFHNFCSEKLFRKVDFLYTTSKLEEFIAKKMNS